MPVYEYQCPSCNYECEVMQKFNDPSPICEFCSRGNPHDPDNDAHMVKQISHSSFILKGGGWAKQGYSKKGKK